MNMKNIYDTLKKVTKRHLIERWGNRGVLKPLMI